MSHDTTFRTERTLPFTPEAIYKAFALPEVLASWWGPEGFTNEFETFEFQVAGRWKFVMVGPDGSRYPNESVFTDLVLDSRVQIRHDCEPFFTLSVQMTAVNGGTHLQWVQVFDDAQIAQAVKAIVEPANEQNLDRLIRALTNCAP